QREWFRRCHCAKSARPRATIASDHESSGALAPAFPTIRTLRAFANRVQLQIGNERFSRKENRIRRQPHFDPGRLLRLVQGWIDLGAGHFDESYNVKNVTKVKSLRIALTNADAASSSRTWSSNLGFPAGGILPTISGMTAILSHQVPNSTRIS